MRVLVIILVLNSINGFAQVAKNQNLTVREAHSITYEDNDGCILIVSVFNDISLDSNFIKQNIKSSMFEMDTSCKYNYRVSFKPIKEGVKYKLKVFLSAKNLEDGKILLEKGFGWNEYLLVLNTDKLGAKKIKDFKCIDKHFIP